MTVDPHRIPYESNALAWDMLMDEFLSILDEKMQHMAAGKTAEQAEYATLLRRIVWKVKVAKLLRFEAEQ